MLERSDTTGEWMIVEPWQSIDSGWLKDGCTPRSKEDYTYDVRSEVYCYSDKLL